MDYQAETVRTFPNGFRFRIAPWTCATFWWNHFDKEESLAVMADTYTHGFSLQIYKWRFEFNLRRCP
jgi:hypothetical protein